MTNPTVYQFPIRGGSVRLTFENAPTMDAIESLEETLALVKRALARGEEGAK